VSDVEILPGMQMTFARNMLCCCRQLDEAVYIRVCWLWTVHQMMVIGC